MGESLRLSDDVLLRAGTELTSAASLMVNDNKPRPTSGFDSLTNIRDAVLTYLSGVADARAALADAARTGAQATSEIMNRSDELDSLIASTLFTGYAFDGDEQ